MSTKNEKGASAPDPAEDTTRLLKEFIAGLSEGLARDTGCMVAGYIMGARGAEPFSTDQPFSEESREWIVEILTTYFRQMGFLESKVEALRDRALVVCLDRLGVVPDPTKMRNPFGEPS